MQKLLTQTQLSNYDTRGQFILEADSGWQMTLGRARVMLELNPDLMIDVMCPQPHQVITTPEHLNRDLLTKFGNRLKFIPHKIIPNAAMTRYDFDVTSTSRALQTTLMKNDPSKRYTHVYINDPMLLRHFRALFFLNCGYLPKFFVHSHFVDNPEDPKFPTEVSLWLGQCEAALKADYNFWQCRSAMDTFLDSMSKMFHEKLVTNVLKKSSPWDDGYSQHEITSGVKENALRFGTLEFYARTKDKVVIFVPNRVGGRGRSSDYTNCGKFLFDIVPELWKKRQDFVVIAGNPSQKFSNQELIELCPALMNVVPDALKRDEYKYVAIASDVVVGLYDVDTYGGTASRECVELGCVPFWINKFEYSSLARDAGGWPWTVKPDLSDAVKVLDALIEHVKVSKTSEQGRASLIEEQSKLRDVVRSRCSYESTTTDAMKKVGLL